MKVASPVPAAERPAKRVSAKCFSKGQSRTDLTSLSRWHVMNRRGRGGEGEEGRVGNGGEERVREEGGKGKGKRKGRRKGGIG